MMTIITKI